MGCSMLVSLEEFNFPKIQIEMFMDEYRKNNVINAIVLVGDDCHAGKKMFEVVGINSWVVDPTEFQKT